MTNKLTAVFEGGGVAQWGNPMDIGSNLLTFCYEVTSTMRLTIEGCEPAYFSFSIRGMDEINQEGEVTSGFGKVQAEDDQGDRWYGNVDWFLEDGRDKGKLVMRSGTGKWATCTGEFDLDLWGRPAELNAPMPPAGPMKFIGFVEGAGTIEIDE